jgi:hypothetical protein
MVFSSRMYMNAVSSADKLHATKRGAAESNG